MLVKKEDIDFLGLFQPKSWYYTIALAFNIEGDYEEFAFKWTPLEELLLRKESISLIKQERE